MKNPTHPSGTRAWRKLKARVVREEPVCWLRLPGCTLVSQTADHVLTVKEYPELAMSRSNLRGVCYPCNRNRGAMPIGNVVRGDVDASGFFD